MSHLIARILLAILLFPAAGLFNLIAYIFLEQSMRRDEAATWSASLLTFAFIATYWFLLWRKSVNWTGDRKRMTLWAIAGAVAAGAGLRWGMDQVVRYGSDASIFSGVTAASLLWVIATIFVWRESPAERAARISRSDADAIVCPICGYNLTGLKEARCPECGKQFTLNELLASQPSRAAAEIEC